MAAGTITLAMIGCTGPAPTRSSTPRSSPSRYVRNDGQHNAENNRLARQQLAGTLANVNFDNVGLRAALQHLRDIAGMSICVQWEGLLSVGVGKGSLVDVHMTNVSVEQALKAVLDDAGSDVVRLGYSLDDGVLTVGVKEYPADSVRTTVAYDIDSMLPHGTSRRRARSALSDKRGIEWRAKMVGEYMGLICETVSPDAWARAGGKSTIREAGGRLVVTTTSENHTATLDLIAQLRDAAAIQIFVDIRVMGMSEEADRAWKKALVGQGSEHLFCLDDLQMDAVYKALRGRNDMEMHVLERTFFNGEALAVGRRGRRGKGPAMARFLEVEAAISDDRRYVSAAVMWIPSCLANPTRISGSWRLPVPDGGTVILPMPSLADISDADLKSLPDITKHPRVYVIINPRIVIHCECEEFTFPDDDEPPGIPECVPLVPDPIRDKGYRPCTCGKQCGWSTWLAWE